MENTTKINKLIAIGGTDWQKNGNHRIYFSAESLSKISGVDARMIQNIFDMGGEFYYNCVTDKTVFPAAPFFKTDIIPSIKNAMMK